ncbi:MAG TPA: isoprenylcysteine carboxylmethyltransferase family protein [Polyangiales bacterium]
MHLVRAYAVFAYAMFNASFLCLVAFVTLSVDDGSSQTDLSSFAIDLALVLFFGLTHSLMARARFKQLWTKLVPAGAERSTYVLVASAQIALLCWQWRSLDAPSLWVTTGSLALAVRVLQAAGWAIALLSTFQIDHFELFGLRQAFGGRAQPPELRTPLFYRWVRHPLYFGMLVALWSAPTMSASHLLLSASLTLYILIGVRHEERDLVRTFGDAYRTYQAAVPMLLPGVRPWRLAAVRASE